MLPLGPKGLQFGAGGESLDWVVSTSRFAGNSHRPGFNGHLESSNGLLSLMQAGRLSGSCRRVVGEFPDRFPGTVFSELCLDNGFAVAGIEPAAVVKGSAMHKCNSAQEHRLLQGDGEPVLGG